MSKAGNPTEELLCEIYRNTKMGTETVNSVIPKTSDKFLLKDLTSELETYSAYSEQASQMMRDRNIEPKDLSLGKKIGAKTGIAINTLTDSSTSHIAEMVMKGSHMGADELESSIARFSKEGSDTEVVNFGNRVVGYERAEAEKMRGYL